MIKRDKQLPDNEIPVGGLATEAIFLTHPIDFSHWKGLILNGDATIEEFALRAEPHLVECEPCRDAAEPFITELKRELQKREEG